VGRRGQQSRGAQVGIVIDGEGGLTVISGGARGEALPGELVSQVHQRLLARGWSQVYEVSPLQEKHPGSKEVANAFREWSFSKLGLLRREAAIYHQFAAGDK
jgi:hypothetical protein